MQNDTTEQLNVVMNHVPYRIIAAGIPVVLVDGLVAFNAYEVFAQIDKIEKEILEKYEKALEEVLPLSLIHI